MLKILKYINILSIKKILTIKVNVHNITNENLNDIIFKIIFNNYKLNILYKTNVKRKKKKENFMRLNIFRNSSVKSNISNATFN